MYIYIYIYIYIKWYDRKQNVAGKLLILVFHVQGIDDSIFSPGSSYSGANSQLYRFSFNELGANWNLFSVDSCRRNVVINITPKYEKQKRKFRIFSRSFIHYSEVMRGSVQWNETFDRIQNLYTALLVTELREVTLKRKLAPIKAYVFGCATARSV